MPYAEVKDLPEATQEAIALWSVAAQTRYLEVLNTLLDKYEEGKAFALAFSTVEKMVEAKKLSAKITRTIAAAPDTYYQLMEYPDGRLEQVSYTRDVAELEELYTNTLSRMYQPEKNAGYPVSVLLEHNDTCPVGRLTSIEWVDDPDRGIARIDGVFEIDSPEVFEDVYNNKLFVSPGQYNMDNGAGAQGWFIYEVSLVKQPAQRQYLGGKMLVDTKDVTTRLEAEKVELAEKVKALEAEKVELAAFKEAVLRRELAEKVKALGYPEGINERLLTYVVKDEGILQLLLDIKGLPDISPAAKTVAVEAKELSGEEKINTIRDKAVKKLTKE